MAGIPGLSGGLGKTVASAFVTAAIVIAVAGIVSMLVPQVGSGLDNVVKVTAGAVLAGIVGGMLSSIKGGIFVKGALFAVSTMVVGILAFGDTAALDVMFVVGKTIVFVAADYVTRLGK